MLASVWGHVTAQLAKENWAAAHKAMTEVTIPSVAYLVIFYHLRHKDRGLQLPPFVEWAMQVGAGGLYG